MVIRLHKNKLTPHPAHPVDIFSLAVTDKQILSASGSPCLKVHSTIEADFPLVQSIDGAHTLGCHHVVTDAKGSRAVSAGFAGDIKVWSCQDGHWSADETSSGTVFTLDERSTLTQY